MDFYLSVVESPRGSGGLGVFVLSILDIRHLHELKMFGGVTIAIVWHTYGGSDAGNRVTKASRIIPMLRKIGVRGEIPFKVNSNTHLRMKYHCIAGQPRRCGKQDQTLRELSFQIVVEQPPSQLDYRLHRLLKC